MTVSDHQRDLAIALAQRWQVPRDELDRAADALGVARVTDEEWAEICGPA
ncbi:hypothetical protein [Streptosporangium lutulentum]|uniref:Uncharacterized protein n=1 Tax=Streptosporangium lutulentum TaxID=1461250 RepID=A0ABT9Q6A2_9ACTN|nr:hypothetical protein [Streptosporangium lutulentum]MDP9842279.1 hypothetical protein [Streptosporangium lutulentum]